MWSSKEYNKAYRERNPERFMAYRMAERAKRLAGRHTVEQRKVERHEAAVIRAKARRPEVRRAFKKRLQQRKMYARIVWVLTHPVEVEEHRLEVIRRRRLRWRLKNHVRRTRLRSDGSTKRLNLSVIDKLMKLQKSRCLVCGSSIKKNFRIDHVLPLALGGSNSPQNIQLLCHPCNSSKWHKHPVEFMQSRGFLI